MRKRLYERTGGDSLAGGNRMNNNSRRSRDSEGTFPEALIEVFPRRAAARDLNHSSRNERAPDDRFDEERVNAVRDAHQNRAAAGCGCRRAVMLPPRLVAH